ncbi:hypothetical protein QNO09_30215 [Streptomyces sp. 378]|uniref:hypothetical protein n=1 Tax=Streptomyces sp. 378 TaxID=3049412 RepID=UPI0024C27A0C|nr:hypothetical protein [Streptomyces sp. 378]MDK1347500.1 hypothetical protein [Streptomyces sp. 378]
MSDNQKEPVEPVGAGTTSQPVPELPERPVRRARAAAVALSALLAVAVVGGAGYTVVAVNGADRDAGAPVWAFPEPRREAEAGKKAAPSELAGMLVPYGTNGWGPGPDLGEYGPDTALSGRKATALRKEALSGLPRTQRKRLEKAVDEQRITGIAMRSYLSTTKLSDGFTDEAFAVRVELSQRENRDAVRDASRSRGAFLDALDVFRAGPKIEGHKNASCFLPPKDDDEELETMLCFGHVGNVLVTIVADGAKPLDTKGAAMLFREQLDRISEPGKAI